MVIFPINYTYSFSRQTFFLIDLKFRLIYLIYFSRDYFWNIHFVDFSNIYFFLHFLF